jgi:hypothetical protein
MLAAPAEVDVLVQRAGHVLHPAPGPGRGHDILGIMRVVKGNAEVGAVVLPATAERVRPEGHLRVDVVLDVRFNKYIFSVSME